MPIQKLKKWVSYQFLYSQNLSSTNTALFFIFFTTLLFNLIFLFHFVIIVSA